MRITPKYFALFLLPIFPLVTIEGGSPKVLDVLHQPESGLPNIIAKAQLPIAARHLHKSVSFISRSIRSLAPSTAPGLIQSIASLKVDSIADWSLKQRLMKLFVKKYEALTREEVLEIFNGLIYLSNRYGKIEEQFWIHLELAEDAPSIRGVNHYLRLTPKKFTPPKPHKLDQSLVNNVPAIQEVAYKMWFYFELSDLMEPLIHDLGPRHMGMLLRILRYYETTEDTDEKRQIYFTLTSLRDEFIKYGSDIENDNFVHVFNVHLFTLSQLTRGSQCHWPNAIEAD